eukprot:CAMPEP_0197574774 /NCGR_PEP_ID=MMETSP1326-20131121/395_1 /TAXON_ID=1155430 /ORGANISM="Genus nov. species nov., Strain RCC2288" /LENGTH=105 /DNA_ID=CAMNT_0043137415 /DNA_START=244 /DNA_END=557 /DNA_ORIENTATION=-
MAAQASASGRCCLATSVASRRGLRLRVTPGGSSSSSAWVAPPDRVARWLWRRTTLSSAAGHAAAATGAQHQHQHQHTRLAAASDSGGSSGGVSGGEGGVDGVDGG